MIVRWPSHTNTHAKSSIDELKSTMSRAYARRIGQAVLGVEGGVKSGHVRNVVRDTCREERECDAAVALTP